MKKALITVLVLIIAFGALSIYGENRIESTANDLQFTLETVYGDASAAEGLEIIDFVIALQDNYGRLGYWKYYTWTTGLRIEGGSVNIVSLNTERDADRDSNIRQFWPESVIDTDYNGRQRSEVEDLDGKCIYKVYKKDGYYYADVVDAVSGNVLHTVQVAEGSNLWTVYPRLFAGRGSAVIAIVEDKSAGDPRYGWDANDIFCITADGELLEADLKNYVFDGKSYYPTRLTGYIAAASKGDRLAIVQRVWELSVRDDSSEYIGSDYPVMGQIVYVFGPEGLEFLGLIRCSLADAAVFGERLITGNAEGLLRFPFMYFSAEEIGTSISW